MYMSFLYIITLNTQHKIECYSCYVGQLFWFYSPHNSHHPTSSISSFVKQTNQKSPHYQINSPPTPEFE